jgi:hypothetical protein
LKIALDTLYHHAVETEQIMAHLVAKMKAEMGTKQVMKDASIKEMKEEMMARLESKIEVNLIEDRIQP